MAIEDLELKKKKKNLKNGIAKEMEILEIENYAIFIWYNSWNNEDIHFAYNVISK